MWQPLNGRSFFQTLSTVSPSFDITLRVVLIAVHQLFVFHCSNGLCLFPDFVQTNASSSLFSSPNVSSPTSSPVIRDWRTRVTTSSSGVNIFGARVLIDGGLMRVIVNSTNDSATWLSPAFQSRQCVLVVEDGGGNSGGGSTGTTLTIHASRKFIVLYRERNSSSMPTAAAATPSTRVSRLYQCIQFVLHTDAIFQASFLLLCVYYTLLLLFSVMRNFRKRKSIMSLVALIIVTYADYQESNKTLHCMPKFWLIHGSHLILFELH
jgi:hypothetical protein